MTAINYDTKRDLGDGREKWKRKASRTRLKGSWIKLCTCARKVSGIKSNKKNCFDISKHSGCTARQTHVQRVDDCVTAVNYVTKQDVNYITLAVLHGPRTMCVPIVFYVTRGASNIPADFRAHIQRKRRVATKGALKTCAREVAKRRSGEAGVTLVDRVPVNKVPYRTGFHVCRKNRIAPVLRTRSQLIHG